MKILIVAATPYEIAPLLKAFDFEQLSDIRLYQCNEKDYSIHFLITGIGIGATSYYLTKTILEQSYDFALNAGICGSFKRKNAIGKTFRVTNDVIADLGSEDREEFLPAEKWLNTQEINSTLYKGEAINNFKFHLIARLPKASGITVNTVSGNNDTIKSRIKNFNADVESMEGAAFMAICNKEKLSCEQVRTVSNFIEPRNEAAWNIPLAIKNLNEFLFKFIESELSERRLS